MTHFHEVFPLIKLAASAASGGADFCSIGRSNTSGPDDRFFQFD
jgi:hypothetical protein